jgi:FMN phosphatase YigB (HAD superfamily)
MISEKNLYIFDLDGTLVDDMAFYRKIYTENLESLVLERHGAEGMKIVDMVRASNRGKGELALLVLGIPYKDWFEKTSDDQLSQLAGQPDRVKAIRGLKGKKVVFTGTSRSLANKILDRIGFDNNDFVEVIAFDPPAVAPLKLTADPLTFRYLLEKYNGGPAKTYMIGDEYEFDLSPAKALGIHTVEVRHNSHKAERSFPTIAEVLAYLKSTE